MSNPAQTAPAQSKPTSAPPPAAKPAAPKPAKPIPIPNGTALLNGGTGISKPRRTARSEDGRFGRSEEEERRGRSRDVRPLR
ncbi:hypothetical protein DACRYDRAFT_21542 [Dacryopinax primogenitus]|uniref:Uncharacterized protein n=1 Tax=Dacryopinax primogenitus (strain DJM 731) TaxID=1858805 RepID=M5FZ75_DACPD|nr:uncharacterized protein DACRYDRAFT_21542 [Dacryopinax primogenitus]EJU03346.1 hypothetical protein DACRYDRAFT_21542 [Dacryopinax primogenitus]